MNIIKSYDIENIVTRHPHVANRFMVNKEFHNIIVPDIIDVFEEVADCNIEIESYDFDLNNTEPILCLWLDCDRNIEFNKQMSVEQAGRNIGFECATWFDKTKGVTRISIWKVISKEISTALENMSHE